MKKVNSSLFDERHKNLKKTKKYLLCFLAIAILLSIAMLVSDIIINAINITKIIIYALSILMSVSMIGIVIKIDKETSQK